MDFVGIKVRTKLGIGLPDPAGLGVPAGLGIRKLGEVCQDRLVYSIVLTYITNLTIPSFRQSSLLPKSTLINFLYLGVKGEHSWSFNLIATIF